MGGWRATGTENSAFMSECCETRETRQFRGCDAWVDGRARDVVGDGRKFVIVSDCCDGVEFGEFVVLSRAGGRFILCRGSICCRSVAAYHPTLQRQQLVDGLVTVHAVAPLAGSCSYSSFKRTGAIRGAYGEPRKSIPRPAPRAPRPAPRAPRPARLVPTL